jgi:hypothetical protein
MLKPGWPALGASDQAHREWQLRAPNLRPSDDVTNGRVARELPVATALLIRRVIAQQQTLARAVQRPTLTTPKAGHVVPSAL